MKAILGMHEDTNANAAVIAPDGRVLAAVAEGRLGRIKYQSGFPSRALDWLGAEGFDRRDPDVAIAAANPLHPLPRLLGDRMPSGTRDFLAPLQTAHLLWHELLYRSSALRTLVRGVSARRLRTLLDREAALIGHHAAHAASAYYCGPWDEATVVTCDNMGDGECARVFHGRAGRLEPLWSVGAWSSPGQFYGEVAAVLGIDPMTAGKVTGLAARGNPADAARLLRSRLEATRRGFRGPGLRARRRGAATWETARSMPIADVAAGAQQVLEEALIPFVLEAVRATGCPRVALAGGVFANVTLNRRILELPAVEAVHVHPAMSDQGVGLGAALLHLARTSGLAPKPLPHVFLGPRFDDGALESAVDGLGDGFVVERPDDPARVVARMLAEGAVVARFDGALEYGPRALGNRSILARPDDPSVNDWLNARLDRDEYMPFAPVTLESEAAALYALAGAETCVPFMTIALPVTGAGQEHAAVVHVDGTARPQVLAPDANPGLHAILTAFHRRTGIPSLVNTSFNRHGEPIVCTPAEAVQTFLSARLDALLMGPLLIRRSTPASRAVS